ncbi:MAG: hypothetical protein U0941_01540 [Planctomycetaceae bacterium]
MAENLHILGLRTTGICQAIQGAAFPAEFAEFAIRSFRKFADTLRQISLDGTEDDREKFNRANDECKMILEKLQTAASRLTTRPLNEVQASDYLADPTEWKITVRDMERALGIAVYSLRKSILSRISKADRIPGSGQRPEFVFWTAVRQVIIDYPDDFPHLPNDVAKLDQLMKDTLQKTIWN